MCAFDKELDGVRGGWLDLLHYPRLSVIALNALGDGGQAVRVG